MDTPDLSIIIPAYNEVATVATVVRRTIEVLETLPHSHELIVVDDGSSDGTGDAAEAEGARVIRHPVNIGNGAAIKTGIRSARGETLVLFDGDGQHAPEDIPRLLEKAKTFDLVVGARTAASKTAFHRKIAQSVYNLCASYVCGMKIEDLISGFRVIKAPLAKSLVGLLPNTFSSPTTMTLATIRGGYSLAYVPITAASRTGKSKIKLIRDGVRFLLIIMKIATLFSPLKIFLPISLCMFMGGVGYGLYRIIGLGRGYGPTAAMLITISFLVFLVGLVSEQIAQLRADMVGHSMAPVEKVTVSAEGHDTGVQRPMSVPPSASLWDKDIRTGKVHRR